MRPRSRSGPSEAPCPAFAARVVDWQRRAGRHDLPWQREADPYRVWLSEVMLQQTQVATVVPYFERFVAALPDVGTLARAPLDRVLELWSGLGYYSRARNLHRAAQVVIDAHGGTLPARVEALQSLPGIGRSTAAAICALAHGHRAAILDGNVKRVLARHRGIEGYPGDRQVEQQLWALAGRLLPGDRPDAVVSASTMRAYTQGLMDLGATVCTRSRPACSVCPVAGDCVARRDDRTHELPAARPRRALPHRRVQVLILESQGRILLERRPPAGIWGGLWSLPEAPAGAALAEHCRACWAVEPRVVERLPDLEHAFTHFTLTLEPARLAVDATAAIAGHAQAAWWLPADAVRAALPAPIKRLLRAVAIA